MKLLSAKPEMLLLALGLFSALPCLAAAPAAPAPAAPAIPTDCNKSMADLEKRIAEDDRYAPVRNALSGDPRQKCEKNRAAGHDRMMAIRSQEYLRNSSRACGIEDQSLCVGAYSRIKAGLEDYKQKIKKGCEIAAGAASACASATGEAARFRCLAAELRKAAEAEKQAQASIEQAGKDAAEFNRLTTEAKNIYTRDVDVMKNFKPDELSAANAIRDGRIQTAEANNPLQQLRDMENRPTVTSGAVSGTVLASYGGASNLSLYQQNAPTLATEQSRAAEAAGGFRTFATDEAKLRLESQNTFIRFAEENEQRALRVGQNQQPPPAVTNPAKTNPSVTGNTTGASLMPAAAPAMALANAANAANQQPATTAASQAAPVGSYPTSTQYPSSLGETTGPGTSLLGKNNGGSNTGKGEPTPAAPSSPSVPKDDTSFNPSVPFAGDTFVSGAGDLPVLGGNSAASRTIASAKSGKIDSTGGASTSGGKKKKDGSPASNCGTDKECQAALGIESAQFNKAGSLGAPLISLSDPGPALGSLDNLFGPMPEDPLLAGKKDPILGALDWGNTGNGSAGEVYTAADGTQAAPEMAPANSKSLFSRVKIAHEKALKRGSVSLFHKKL